MGPACEIPAVPELHAGLGLTDRKDSQLRIADGESVHCPSLAWDRRYAVLRAGNGVARGGAGAYAAGDNRSPGPFVRASDGREMKGSGMRASIRRPRGFAIFGAVLAWVAGSAPAAPPPAPTLSAAHLTQPPKIDGRLNDACWRSATVVRDFWVLDGSAKWSKAAWAKVAFDDRTLYFA